MLEAREFLELAPPQGPLRLKDALAPHLGGLRRPGKGILISDLLFPLAEFQAGINVLRAARLDLLVIQTLGREELTPTSSGVERLVDAESHEESDVRFDERTRALYLANLARHRRDLRNLCHRSGVQFAFYDTSTDLEEFVLTELPALGLLRE